MKDKERQCYDPVMCVLCYASHGGDGCGYFSPFSLLGGGNLGVAAGYPGGVSACPVWILCG